MDWTEYVEAAVRAAEAGGRVLQDWRGRFSVSEKSRANLVTEADFASQKAIADVLGDAFSDHAMLGEEGLDRRSDGSEFCWIIDPLDGTSNYVHGFPYYAVSIALEYRGELVVGVILDPNRGEVFSAWLGGGAWLNGVRMTPSGVASLDRALIVASLPVGVDASHFAVRRFLKVFSRAQSLQRTGSAALNLAYVAAGRVDGFFSSSLKPWDMAAGVVLVREAGGCVSRQDGNPFDVRVSDVLATASEPLSAQLVGVIGE